MVIQQPLVSKPSPSAHSARPRIGGGASWLYPLKGIYYFCTHRFLWPVLRARLLPCVILSLTVIALLFIFTYLPQVALLAIFQGHLAWFNAAVLVLGEGAAITAILFEAFLVDESLVDVFDAVLIDRGFLDLVSSCRNIHHEESDALKKLGKPTMATHYAPFSFRQICEFVLFLPLNFIPLVGTPAFLILTGYRAGPFQHWRYFKLLGWSGKERRRFVRQRKWRYTWFGTMALILQLVPVLSMLFLLTTAAGAALWAARLEEQRRQEQIPAPEPYADDTVRNDTP